MMQPGITDLTKVIVRNMKRQIRWNGNGGKVYTIFIQCTFP